EIMKKTIKADDTFIDIGANIGYLSCIGAGLVGKRGQVHSFEPTPRYFKRFEEMAKANPDYTIVANNCALGEVPGKAKLDITSRPNIGWNKMVPNFMQGEPIRDSIEVPVCRLDEYIKEKQLDKISLIKIDVEGFEFPVLKGLQSYFDNNNHLPVIICEIAPAAYPLLGYTLSQLSSYIAKYKYRAFSVVYPRNRVDITNLSQTTNVVFRPFR
ncbi:MAG: FkbM family methyltransferase, partial [Dehalococcoidia bacterium]